ncbi:MAG: c-type cytochrome [Pseudomonadota bacterium]|nr:c-type cytochrome [Pseudomonadota bacterium]
MDRYPLKNLLWAACAGLAFSTPAGAAGERSDIERGARAARACMACHSFVPGEHLTGPSLAGIWGRKAGTAAGFARYSRALKESGLVWDEARLDAWLTKPPALVPGNEMNFAGIADAQTRADVLAYLRVASERQAPVAQRRLSDLKAAQASGRVTSIRYCGDGYRVTTADQKVHTFWEFNLRFKTDSSAQGPASGRPVIVGNGMGGDRAAVVFGRPEDISAFVRRQCP